MYQEFNLVPPLAVSANILLGREPMGMAGVGSNKIRNPDLRWN